MSVFLTRLKHVLNRWVAYFDVGMAVSDTARLLNMALLLDHVGASQREAIKANLKGEFARLPKAQQIEIERKFTDKLN